MDFFSKYKYPVIIVLIVIVAGWVYLHFFLEVDDATLVQDQRRLDEYVTRMEAIEGLRLETGLFEGEVYLSLTDEFEEDVMEVSIGKINPFSPIR